MAALGHHTREKKTQGTERFSVFIKLMRGEIVTDFDLAANIFHIIKYYNHISFFGNISLEWKTSKLVLISPVTINIYRHTEISSNLSIN